MKIDAVNATTSALKKLFIFSGSRSRNRFYREAFTISIALLKVAYQNNFHILRYIY